MSLWSRSLGWRLAIAFACSVTAIGVLSVVVEQFDEPPKPTKRARSSGGERLAARLGATKAGDGEGTPDLKARHEALAMASPSAPATLARALGFRLQPTSGTILVTHRESALAPDVVPVVEILANGEVVLRRPMPVASGPVPVAPVSGQGHGAGLILPVRNLRLLSPEARAALIGLLQLWFTERPVLPAKLVSNDLELAPEALRRLLSWVP